MNLEDCIFCKIVRGAAPAQRVHEDELTLALMDIFPVTDGHTLVITKAGGEALEARLGQGGVK